MLPTGDPATDFSDEEMAKGWTLSEADKKEVNRYRTNSRLFIVIQLCAVRLYGRFLVEVNDVSPRISKDVKQLSCCAG